MNLKDQLITLLADHRVESAIKTAMKHLDDSYPDYGQLVNFSARWERIEEEIRTENLSAEEASLQQSQLVNALIAFSQDLPEEMRVEEEQEPQNIPTPVTKPKGILEEKFKWHLFIGIISIKGILFLFLLYNKSTGGMISRDFNILMGILLPVFSTSLVLMAKYLFDKRGKTMDPTGPRINRGNQFFAYLILIVYTISISMAVANFSSKHANFDALLGWVNGTEVMLGALLGYMVATLFKAEKT